MFYHSTGPPILSRKSIWSFPRRDVIIQNTTSYSAHGLQRERVQELYGLEYSDESIAIVALLHDLCKIGCYKKGTRNVKDESGKWQTVPSYTFDDPLPYGHGEKSVYIANGYIRLNREEAMAIRWHMGFSGPEDNRLVGRAFAKYPLAFALSVADMEASYFLENEDRL